MKHLSSGTDAGEIAGEEVEGTVLFWLGRGEVTDLEKLLIIYAHMLHSMINIIITNFLAYEFASPRGPSHFML